MSAREEQTKLAANYCNGLAIAMAVFGVLQPLLGEAWSIPILLRALVCILISLLLHLLGQAILSGLK